MALIIILGGWQEDLATLCDKNRYALQYLATMPQSHSQDEELSPE